MLEQFVDLRGAWKERGEWCFLGGLIPQCPLWFCSFELVQPHPWKGGILKKNKKTEESDYIDETNSEAPCEREGTVIIGGSGCFNKMRMTEKQ